MADVPGAPGERCVVSLNGWWDFQPAAEDLTSPPPRPETVPVDGWQDKAYLVPGFFTDHPYPEAWRETRSGWARTRFQVDAIPEGRRAWLTIGAAIPLAQVFVNGKKVAVQEDMFLGGAVDVTEVLRVGENELAVFLCPFASIANPNDPTSRLIDVPWGCCIAHDQAGIWQDVKLEWRGAVHFADITIRTSTREGKLTVIAAIENRTDKAFAGRFALAVEDESAEVLNLSPTEVALGPSETREYTVEAAWTTYRPWFPEDPKLYHLRARLWHGNAAADVLRTRFGFREVWIEGHRILLNGRPQRWGGEWCHKSHSHWLRPEYVRQWYQQIKDLNCHYVRMHTFPHPEYFLDIADEMGIMVCQESALHGSGTWGHDTPQLWERARLHVRRVVRRDKNHPSLVIWSVENEMRWALHVVPSAKDELPKLRALFNELDPTRTAYHDGDSSLWNEATQPILSRHYGPSCHGLGWWDRSRPLHAGEMGRWHYGSPYVALQWAGDEVYADYAELSRSLARDAARIVELARANEVSCCFIWNTSGLDNFRPAEKREFKWDDPASPAAKPLAHKPYESEYAWWEEGAGYRPGFSFETMKHSFRPLAIVVREERTQFYTDRSAPHTVWVVNDLAADVAGELEVRLEQDGATVWQDSRSMSIAAGQTGNEAWQVPLDGAKEGAAAIVTIFRCEQGEDIVRREVRLTSAEARSTKLDLPPVAVWGESTILPWLKAHGVNAVQLSGNTALNPKATPLLIVGERAVQPGTNQNQRVRDFMAAGGCVLVLEQAHSLFPGLAMERMPIEMAHVRDASHPMLAGVVEEDLRFFGDDPFGLPSSDSWVTINPFVKPTESEVVRPIVDSSGGDFGQGGLKWAPVVEVQSGAGLLIAAQLRFADRLNELPVADRMLWQALAYLAAGARPGERTVGVDGYMIDHLADTLAVMRSGAVTPAIATKQSAISIVSGSAVHTLDPSTWRQFAYDGGTLVVWGLSEETVAYWQSVIERPIAIFEPEHAVYQLVATGPTPLLRGISNEDTCWLENWAYTPANRKEAIVRRLVDIEGATVHLQNATRSGLDWLFGDDRFSEWARMPCLSEYFDAPPPKVGAGLVEVKVGDGRVLFCQVLWRPELWQFRRFLGLLMLNLGLATATDVLAGTMTPGEQAGEGFPVEVRAASTDEAGLEELVGMSKRQIEHLGENFTFREWPGWKRVPAPGGKLSAQEAGTGLVAIGLEVTSPEPRKFMQTVGGLPNPDLQTFLRMEGRGKVRVWIDGAAWGSFDLPARGPVCAADIDLEAGANSVLLAWEPDSEKAELSLRFENKDRRPETTFGFA
jgi:hypothetical protein